MILQINNLQDIINVSQELEDIIEKVAQEVKKVEGISKEVEVSFALVDDAYIQELNKNYRGKDCPTDVLSFAFRDEAEDGFEEDIFGELGGPEEMLGDIIISLETAMRQAVEYGHSFNREVAFLALHGFLHLLGYDHVDEAEEKVMLERQETILNSLGYNR